MKILDFYIDVSVRSAEAVKALATLDDASDKAKAGLTKVGAAADAGNTKFAAFAKGAGRLATGLATAANTAATAMSPLILAFGRTAIESARSAQEAASKFETVLGAQAAAARKQADALAEAQGRSKYQTRQSVGDLATLATGYGLTEAEATKFALATHKLGVDLASFHEGLDSDLIDAIRSAYAGEFEPLAGRAGIKLSAEAIKQELKRLGIDEKRATNAQKMLATQTAIMRVAERQKAAGDAERTKRSNANLKKTADAKQFDASVEAGKKLEAFDKKVQIVKGRLAEIFLSMNDGAQTATVGVAGLLSVLSPVLSLYQLVALSKASTALKTMADGTAKAGSKISAMASLAERARAGLARFAAFLATRASAALAKLGSGLRIVGQAILWVGRAFLANPILLVIAALAAAAIYLWQNWSWIGPKFWALWETVKQGFAQGIANVKAMLMQAVEFYLSLPGRLASIGLDLMRGLANGILSGIGWVRDAVLGVAARIKGWFANPLDIRSPSGVFAAFGWDINRGLATGLESSAKLALGASAKLANALASQGFQRSLAMAGPTATIYRQPIRSTAGMSQRNSTTNHNINHAGVSVINNINGARDPHATARAVRTELDRRDLGAALRSTK